MGVARALAGPVDLPEVIDAAVNRGTKRGIEHLLLDGTLIDTFVEHGIAHLKTRWWALRRVSLCSWRISAIVAAALVLSQLENRY